MLSDTPFPVISAKVQFETITFRPLSVVTAQTIKPIGQGAWTVPICWD
jgi:hypothetical protein